MFYIMVILKFLTVGK